MLDTAFIKEKLDLITRDLKRLEEYHGCTIHEMAQDYVRYSVLKNLLMEIIGRAIDINQHIVSELGRGNEPLRGYEDTFYALAKIGVYGEDFAKEIAPSAGLRNRLVHEYNNTKEEIIFDSVSDALKDYAKYCDFILKFVA